MEPECPLPHSQVPSNCSYPAPAQSSSYPHIPLPEDQSYYSSSLCSFLHSPVTSYLLGPNILLNALFSNTLSLRSSLNVSDQVSHPYKSISKIISQTELYSENKLNCNFYLFLSERTSFLKITKSKAN
jgi:hypothetical protein